MSVRAIPPDRLDELAAMVGFSIKEANKVGISALLLSLRVGVMQCADSLPIEYPPALLFDPRWQQP
jgi:hypothetical protein